jgi:energy-coupling factor transport system ATP-binding protein
VAALAELNLTVNHGEALFVTGHSGSGKTSLARLINGLGWNYYGAKIEGEILLEGQSILTQNLFSIAKSVKTVFQEPDREIFALTPKDDFLLALECRGVDQREARELLELWYEKSELKEAAERPVHLLSSGEKQKAVLACALALKPKIILLDEPTSNLDLQSTKVLLESLKEAKKEGAAIIITDHRWQWLEELIDRAALLENGRLKDLKETSVINLKTLAQKWSLRPTVENDDSPPPPPAPDGAQPFRVEGLSFAFNDKKNKSGVKTIFTNLGFSLPKESALAVTGPNGSGKTTLARLLAGLAEPSAGAVFFSGRKASKNHRLALTSLALQNAERQLAMNSAQAELAQAASASKAFSQDLENYLSQWGLENLSQRHPQSLSGGEKQRLVLACTFARKADLLILDEPTAGLDDERLSMVAEKVRQRAHEGGRVILITHDRHLVLNCCQSELKLN